MGGRQWVGCRTHSVRPGVLSLPPVSANEFIFMCVFGHDQQLCDGGMCVCVCMCDGGMCVRAHVCMCGVLQFT